jgi:hypothetical protein
MADPTPRPQDSGLRAALAMAAAQRPRPDLPAPDAPALDIFRWRIHDYPPDIAADWTALAIRLPEGELPALGQLIDRTHDWLYNQTVEETEAFAARKLAHLADLPALWHMLDAHVHKGCVVAEPEHCPVCQREGGPS